MGSDEGSSLLNSNLKKSVLQVDGSVSSSGSASVNSSQAGFLPRYVFRGNTVSQFNLILDTEVCLEPLFFSVSIKIVSLKNIPSFTSVLHLPSLPQDFFSFSVQLKWSAP